MATLKIPQLDLFHHRRSHENVSNARIDKKIRNIQMETQNDRIRNVRNPYRQYQNLLVQSSYQAASQNRYKHIAEDYLMKRNRLPSYFLQPTPCIYPLTSFPYDSSPQRSRRANNPCDCQKAAIHRHSPPIKNNRYIGLRDQNIPQRQTLLLKDPYLQETFRGNNSYVTEIHKEVKNISRNSYVNQKITFGQQNNSQILEKLRTHQSEEQKSVVKNKLMNKQLVSQYIQTQILPVNNSVVQNKSQKYMKTSRYQSKLNIQRILSQQKQLIDSLKIDLERQNTYKHQIQDLASTRDQYIQKSREILLKLNLMADDEKQYGFCHKTKPEKKRINIFGLIEI